LLLVIAIVHSTLTPVIYRRWTPGAVWFLGTGLGLLLLALLNLTHVGAEPSRHPAARVVRWANWIFLLFGIGAVVAVPEPQAFVVVSALAVQAVVAHWTLPGRRAADHS
jgi:hypothetical protein